jgi:NAD(P)H-dependent FMN reductase
MRVVALSGSVRAASSNTTLLRAAIAAAPPGVEIALFDGLLALPHFNPDRDESAPPEVLDFRGRFAAADGFLVSSPEYAHGVPGVLKDALDWLVGSGELVGKPVVVLDTSSRATHAHASLVETLTVMSALVTTFPVPLLGKKLDVAGMRADPEVSAALAAALAGLVGAVERARGTA